MTLFRDLAQPREWPRPTTPQPDDDRLADFVMDSVCEATDGCDNIEPDGWCEHGHPSWLIQLGLV